MGSGKTTAGKKLAARLAYEYIDLDQFIEQAERDSISNIFEKKGENHFRELESKYLRKISAKNNCVISTGGGAPCFHSNIDFMNNAGFTVYLKMEPEQLLSRLRDAKEQRPLIREKNNEELLLFIKQKLKEREKFYRKAQLITNGFDLNMNELIKQIPV